MRRRTASRAWSSTATATSASRNSTRRAWTAWPARSSARSDRFSLPPASCCGATAAVAPSKDSTRRPPEIFGDVPAAAEIVENGVAFLADPAGGQKTGWFFDHRENRARAARLAGNLRMLDLYCYLGGFGLQAAAAGASGVLCIDRSAPALDLAARAAETAGLADRCRFEKTEAFSALASLAGERFDVVAADPPAFVKARKDLKPGARGYRKLARLAASVVAPDGVLCIASCSHHVDAALFGEQVRRGLRDAGRAGRILHAGGAGPDHPIHPHLPESAYLKCLFVQLD